MKKIKRTRKDLELLNNIYEFIGEMKGRENNQDFIEKKMVAIVEAWNKKMYAKPSELKNMVPKQMYELMTGHPGMEKSKKKIIRRKRANRKTKNTNL